MLACMLACMLARTQRVGCDAQLAAQGRARAGTTHVRPHAHQLQLINYPQSWSPHLHPISSCILAQISSVCLAHSEASKANKPMGLGCLQPRPAHCYPALPRPTLSCPMPTCAAQGVRATCWWRTRCRQALRCTTATSKVRLKGHACGVVPRLGVGLLGMR